MYNGVRGAPGVWYAGGLPVLPSPYSRLPPLYPIRPIKAMEPGQFTNKCFKNRRDKGRPQKRGRPLRHGSHTATLIEAATPL